MGIIMDRYPTKGQGRFNGAPRGDSAFYFGFRRVGELEKVKLVMRHFDTVARRYDWMNTLLSFGLHLLWKRLAVEVLRLNSGDRVIDVCGGTGDLSILAAKAVGPTSRVILYDFNRAMMFRGRPKVARNGLADRIRFILGDAERISSREERFDAAMVGFGIRNLTHMEKGFQEMHRILRPGGKLLCLEFSRPTAPFFRWLYDLYSFRIMPFIGKILVGSKQAYTYLPESIRMFPRPDELKDMLQQIGFTRVTYRKLTNGIAVIHVGVKA